MTDLRGRIDMVLDGGKASQLRYAGMAADRAQLKTYLDALAAVSEADFKSWNKNQQLAFLINAYNANMVEKILLRYPNIKSVWDYGKLIGNPFKDNFINLFGRKMTLDNIEHDTIRAAGHQPIMAFWHGRILPATYYFRNRGIVVND